MSKQQKSDEQKRKDQASKNLSCRDTRLAKDFGFKDVPGLKAVKQFRDLVSKALRESPEIYALPLNVSTCVVVITLQSNFLYF